MGEKLFNSFISALFGGLAGIGAVWYLGADPKTGPVPENVPSSLPANAVFDTLEVKQLKVTEEVRVHDSVSGEPLIEMKDGSILAKKQVLSDHLGANRLVGQRLQITTGDPSLVNNAVCSELASNEDGGAYFALLSPKGTHSVNIGFDKQETGFIISQNNKDSAMVAQAILPLPSHTASEDGTLPTATADMSVPSVPSAPAHTLTAASETPIPAAEPALPLDPLQPASSNPMTSMPITNSIPAMPPAQLPENTNTGNSEIPSFPAVPAVSAVSAANPAVSAADPIGAPAVSQAGNLGTLSVSERSTIPASPGGVF